MTPPARERAGRRVHDRAAHRCAARLEPGNAASLSRTRRRPRRCRGTGCWWWRTMRTPRGRWTGCLTQAGYMVKDRGQTAGGAEAGGERQVRLGGQRPGAAGRNRVRADGAARNKYGLPGIAMSGYGMEQDIVRSRRIRIRRHMSNHQHRTTRVDHPPGSGRGKQMNAGSGMSNIKALHDWK